MEETKNLELRMYFFVPYNLSPIQQGIQAGHAALEYERSFGDTELYQDFVRNHKTWIILNGGTTNKGLTKDPSTGWYANPRKEEYPYLGSLDNIAHQLAFNDIPFSTFQEPDLNNALTAVCFITDERVFNYATYPDFATWLMEVKMYEHAYAIMPGDNKVFLKNMTPDECETYFPEWYSQWKKCVGGEKNIFLRELLKGKSLA